MTKLNLSTLVGKRVGAGRWPYSAAHPDCWQKPHEGLVLALDDPRAWAGTTAFPMQKPDAAEVAAHVAWCQEQNLLATELPVLWDFPSGQMVRWESITSLVSPEDDFAAWQKAREAAYGRAVAA